MIAFPVYSYGTCIPLDESQDDKKKKEDVCRDDAFIKYGLWDNDSSGIEDDVRKIKTRNNKSWAVYM